MITPSAQQELDCVLHSISKQVVPVVYGTDAESPIATLTHVLRHVNRRIELEGQILFEDIAMLRELLPELRAYLLTLDAPGAPGQAAEIERALAAQYCDANTYRSLAIIGKEALALRECLYSGLKLLQTIPKERRDASYAQMRASIRRCVIRQTEQERRLIEPAFFGHGPRR